MLLRGIARQLTSLSGFSHTVLASGLASGAVQACAVAGSRELFKPLACLAALYSTDAQFKKHVFNAKPQSLEFERGGWAPAEGVEGSFVKRNLLRLFGFYSKEATFMRGAQGLYDSVTEAVDDKRLAQALDMPDDFQHAHSLLCLHIWLLLVRLRPEGKPGKQLAQMLYDSFQDDVESRVRKAGVRVRVHKQLVELEKQFYGSSLAYDKAVKGDGPEDLTSALHRNVYMKADGKYEAAKTLARYVRREMACLAMTDSNALFAGNVRLSALRLLPEAEPGQGPAATAGVAAAEGAAQQQQQAGSSTEAAGAGAAV